MEAAPPPRVPAGIALMASSFEDRPFGSYGVKSVPRNDPPLPPPAQPFVIPPPDWEAEERERAEAGEGPGKVPPSNSASAVESMMASAAERGELEEPRAPGPPETSEPLHRPVIPEPDWRAEEKARANRMRYAKLLELLDEEGT
jgi:hypothetical protein